MYNEKEFKSHIKGLKIRKILYMLIFSLLGSALGVIISDYIVDILLFNPILRVIIISISTLFFFWVSTMITFTTDKDVQDGYWKLEVMKNLSEISKKLDNPVNVKKLESIIEGTSTEIEGITAIETEETIIEKQPDITLDEPQANEISKEVSVEPTSVSTDIKADTHITNVDDVINALPLLDFDDDTTENKNN